MQKIFASYPRIESQLSDPAFWQDPEAGRIFDSPEGASFVAALQPIVIPLALVIVLAVWSLTALTVKRLHDRGLSHWLLLVVVLPFLAMVTAPQLTAMFGWSEGPFRFSVLLFLASVLWSVLQFGLLKGETGPNRHGPDPLAG